MTGPYGPSPGTRTLVTGLTGQDGYYLARLLLGRGCHVTGAARPGELAAAQSVAAELGGLALATLDLTDPASIEALVAENQPQIIYHLAAQSSVKLSWDDPVATCQVNAMGTLHMLEAIRRHAPAAALVMASSCDCFDHEAASSRGVTPATPFRATNPYAASKVMAHQLVGCYREKHGLRASAAILFNHTSPRRPELFVERGIVRSAVRVALGLASEVVVGSMETRRDWAWAEDLMEAFARMGAMAEPRDLVLASGATHTVGDWVAETFHQLGLDSARHVREDSTRLHAGDRPHTFGNIEAARAALGWEPTTNLPEMIRRLIEADRAELGTEHQVP